MQCIFNVSFVKFLYAYTCMSLTQQHLQLHKFPPKKHMIVSKHFCWCCVCEALCLLKPFIIMTLELRQVKSMLPYLCLLQCLFIIIIIMILIFLWHSGSCCMYLKGNRKGHFPLAFILLVKWVISCLPSLFRNCLKLFSNTEERRAHRW